MRAAGSTGTLLAGLLAAAGHDVALLPSAREGKASSARGAAARGRGRQALRIVLPTGWLRASVGLRAESAQRGTGLLVSGPEVQAGGARAHVVLLDGCSPLPGPVDARRIPALALASAVQLEAGEVELASARSCFLFPPCELPEVLALAECLRAAGVQTAVVEDMAGCAASWFVGQLLALPPALCRTTPQHFLSFPQGREIARHLLEEGLDVLGRLGHRLARLPCGDPQELLAALGSREQDFEAQRFAPGREWGEALQRALRGERLPPRGPNETLVRLASQAGSSAPWNWRLSGKRGRVQQGAFFRGPAELLEAVG